MKDLFNWNEDLPDIIQVRVTARAANNYIKTEYQEDGSKLIKVYVTAEPVKGASNRAVLSLLAEELNVPKSSLFIEKGLTAKNKTIRIKK